MKKTYIRPKTEVYNIAAQHQLLAGSTLSVSSETYDAGSMTDLSRSYEYEEGF